MRKRCCVLPAIVFLLLSAAQPAFPAVSQSLFFDSRGNLMSSAPATVSPPENGLATPPSAIPEGVELRQGIRYEYYPVHGAAFSDVVKSIQENGPYDANLKKRLPTKITWGFGISYEYNFSSALDEDASAMHVAVEVENLRVSYAITLTLPSLIDNTALNPIEKNLWKNYWLRLLDHEYGHIGIIEDSGIADQAKRSLAEIDYLIFDYREGSDIDSIIGTFLKEEAGKAAREMSGTIREKLNDYDTQTDYGSKSILRDSSVRSVE
jgi:hypothetical protein